MNSSMAAINNDNLSVGEHIDATILLLLYLLLIDRSNSVAHRSNETFQ